MEAIPNRKDCELRRNAITCQPRQLLCPQHSQFTTAHFGDITFNQYLCSYSYLSIIHVRAHILIEGGDSKLYGCFGRNGLFELLFQDSHLFPRRISQGIPNMLSMSGQFPPCSWTKLSESVPNQVSMGPKVKDIEMKLE